MNHLYPQPRARLWTICGLAVMILLAGILLEEGYAGPFSTPLTTEGIPIQKPTLEENHKNPMVTGKMLERKSHPWRPREDENDQIAAQKPEPEKKRLGLALLFLGVLAEKS